MICLWWWDMVQVPGVWIQETESEQSYLGHCNQCPNLEMRCCSRLPLGFQAYDHPLWCCSQPDVSSRREVASIFLRENLWSLTRQLTCEMPPMLFCCSVLLTVISSLADRRSPGMVALIEPWVCLLGFIQLLQWPTAPVDWDPLLLRAVDAQLLELLFWGRVRTTMKIKAAFTVARVRNVSGIVFLQPSKQQQSGSQTAEQEALSW